MPAAKKNLQKPRGYAIIGTGNPDRAFPEIRRGTNGKPAFVMEDGT